MKLQQGVKYAICELGHVPAVARIARRPRVRRVLERIRGLRAIYDSEWARRHPFDRLHGIETSLTKEGPEDPGLAAHVSFRHAHSYAGTQVGPLRTVLRMLPDLSGSTFVDLGCGKGRPLFVATEFPFADIIGVELLPGLAQVARENAATMARRYPERTRVRVELGDAAAYNLPPGNVVLFLYSPFAEPIVTQVGAAIERALAGAPRSFYLIYCNPIYGHCFDSLPNLTRVFTRGISHEEEELGFGPGTADQIALWRGGNAPDLPEEAALSAQSPA